MKTFAGALSKWKVHLNQFLEAIPVGIFITEIYDKYYYSNGISRKILNIGLVATVTSQEFFKVNLVSNAQFSRSNNLPMLKALQQESQRLKGLQNQKTLQICLWDGYFHPSHIQDTQYHLLYLGRYYSPKRFVNAYGVFSGEKPQVSFLMFYCFGK